MTRFPALLLALCATLSLHSQSLQFDFADPQPDIVEVYGGTMAAEDVNADGHLDLMISGLTLNTVLYFGDGNGGFTEAPVQPFPNASSTVTLMEDFDGDGDLDVYFSGNGQIVGHFAHVYLNDGAGTFTQLDNPALPGHNDWGVAAADIDGDGDVDLVISVLQQDGTYHADVFANDGSALFSPVNSSGIPELQFGTIVLEDLDDDGDMDAMISGTQADDTPLFDLFLNDGSGNFSQSSENAFVQMTADDIDAADLDGDGDLDLLASGADQQFNVSTTIYLNDGSGQFTMSTASDVLQDTFAGANAVDDLDNDGDLDLVIVGSQAGGLPNIYNIVYENQGDGNFMPADTLGGEYIADVVTGDFNGDGLPDVIIEGFADDTSVYWNTTPPVSVEETERGVLRCYPNPTSDWVQLEFPGTERYSLRVLDAQGRMVQELDGLRGSTHWIHHLPSGSYVLHVQVDGILHSTQSMLVR